jgi:chromosome partitioning protein
MKVIVVANQKGGSGKSTATVHLATAAEKAGEGPVVVSDTDPQGTTADWYNERKRKAGIDTPRYHNLELDNLGAGIATLRKAGAQYLFIDTAPALAVEASANAQLIKHADLILMPLNPNPADLRALVKGLPLIRAAGRPIHFLLTRVRANLRNNEQMALALEALGLSLPTWMHERVIYAESFAHGRTAFEVEPKGTAAREMTAIWGELKEKLGKK